jgi:GTPase
MTEPNFKSGFAALIGRPNAGKSTLLNAIVGEHIAAVSAKPQTTRTRIQGIITRPEGQIVFMDTPGIHKPGYALNRRMMNYVSDALLQVDIVLLMRDATQRFGQGERFALDLVKEAKKKSFLLLNKIDLIKDKSVLLPIIQAYSEEYDFAEIIPISARKGKNQDLLVSKLIEHLPVGEMLFEADDYTDQRERDIVAELVREKILAVTGDEIPYVTAVRTEMWQEHPELGNAATEIHCVIYVERDSQKPILIGRGGQFLKKVGTEARKDIEKLLGRHVRLNLFVKVQKEWRNDLHLLDQLGIQEINQKDNKEKIDPADFAMTDFPEVESEIETEPIPARSMKIWHALELTFAKAAESAVTPQLWNAGTTGLEVSEDNAATVTMRAYFDVAPDADKLRDDIHQALTHLHLPAEALHKIEALTIADQDWLTEWKKGYEPMNIGERWLVTPSWKRDQVEASERLLIQIDPGMAFGTGTHETTRGCLELLETYWKGGSLLDVGTGTGILAIAAIKLHPQASVIGFDVDPEAITVAEENAEINGVAESLTLETNRLAAFVEQQFDVVLANLTADVVVPLTAELFQVVKSHGVLIVSGILGEQGEEVLKTLMANGFKLIESKPDGEWISYALRSQKTLIG